MRDEVRRKLLAEYAVALVTERESWEHLRDSPLTEAQRCATLAQWKQTAARLKLLAAQLRASSPCVPDAAPAAAVPLHAVPDQPRRSVAVPAATRARARRRVQPLQTFLLAGATRLAAEWRALKATMTASVNG